MNLSKQIKLLRQKHGYSQDDLAEKIYVSRQTISNWETEKSYPDIHNLLLLSVLFDISLDELVKGDLASMKEQDDRMRKEYKKWYTVMFGSLGLMCLSVYPLLRWTGILSTLIVWFLLFCVILFSGFKELRIRKDKGLVTASEIVAFMENKEPDAEKVLKEKKHITRDTILGVCLFATLGGIVGAISVLMALR